MLDCSYRQQLDCNDQVTAREYPGLSLGDSRCIQRKSCGELVANGACTRAQTAKDRVVEMDAGDPEPNPTNVCEK